MPIANTNDGSRADRALRVYMSWLSLDEMPLGPDEEARAGAVAAAGYSGVQLDTFFTSKQVSLCRANGLRLAGSARVNSPADAHEAASRASDAGFDCVTVHAGWGIESDAESLRLLEAILEASARFQIPLYVETHRATVFQDAWRAVQFIGRLPDLRVNGDFSHWYTGLEFVYGGFESKLRFIAPVLERVRFLHGRIGTPGCIQVDIGDGSDDGRPFIGHFRQLWMESMRHFLNSAGPGDFLCFTPELLAPGIYYGHGQSDRWAQSLVLRQIAERCFVEVRHTSCIEETS